MCDSCRWKREFYKHYLQEHATLTQWIQDLHQNAGNQLSSFCSETVHEHFDDTSMMNTIQPSYNFYNRDVHHLHPQSNFDYDAFKHLDIAEKCGSDKGKKRNKDARKVNILQENYKFSNRDVLHHLYPEPNFDYNAFNHFDVDDKCESGKGKKRNKGTRKVNILQENYKFSNRDVLHHLHPEPNFDYDAFNHFEVTDHECESVKAESVKSDSSYIIGDGDELIFDPGSLLDNRRSSESDDSSSEKNVTTSDDFELLEPIHQEFEYVQLDRFGNMPESRDGRSGIPNAQQEAKEEKELKNYLYGSKADTIAGLETATKLDYNRNCDLYQPCLWPVLPIRIKSNKNKSKSDISSPVTVKHQ